MIYMIYIFFKKNNNIEIFFLTSFVTCDMVISNMEIKFLDITFLL